MTDFASLILAVEDEPSAAVARRLVRTFRKDIAVSRVIVSRGYGQLKVNAPRYNQASRRTPFFLLTDLDRADCAPRLIEDWLAGRSREASFLFRVAVREGEAWLLADQSGIAKFLGITPAADRWPAILEYTGFPWMKAHEGKFEAGSTSAIPPLNPGASVCGRPLPCRRPRPSTRLPAARVGR